MRLAFVLLLLPAAALAQAGICGPGRDCDSAAFTARATSAQLGTCDAPRYGRHVFNLDAGSLYLCTSSGWGPVGGSSSAGAYWIDGGAGYTQPASAYVGREDGGFIYMPHVWLDEGTAFVGNNRTAAAMPSGNTIDWYSGGTSLKGRITSNSSGVLELRTSTNLKTFAFIEADGTTGGTVLQGGQFQSQTSSGNEGYVSTSGVRIHPGAGTWDFLYSNGASLVTPTGWRMNAIHVGDAGTIIRAIVTASVTDPGAISAGTCVDTNATVSTGGLSALDGTCEVGGPGGSQTADVICTCYPSDTTTLSLRCCAVGATGRTPAAGTYRMRLTIE